EGPPAAHPLAAPHAAPGCHLDGGDGRRVRGGPDGPGLAAARAPPRLAGSAGAGRGPRRLARPPRPADDVPLPRARENGAVPGGRGRGARPTHPRGGALPPMTPRAAAAPQGARRLPVLELLLCALCLWAGWYRTPAGALVRSIGAWILGTRTTAR